MLFVLHRRLPILLSAVAFFTVAFTTPPPATLFLMPPATMAALAAVGIAAMLSLVPGAMTRLLASRSSVYVARSDHHRPANPSATTH